MRYIIKLFGVLLILLGLLLVIKPNIILVWIDDSKTNITLYVSAIVMRLVIGVLLLIIGKESKYPGVFKVFGSLFILSAVAFLFIGHTTFQDFINAVIPHVNPYAPIVGLFSIAFGGFLIYALSIIDKTLKT